MANSLAASLPLILLPRSFCWRLRHAESADIRLCPRGLREFALLGHRSVAVDLPGHGFEATFPAGYQLPQILGALAAEPGSIKGVTLADDAARVIEVLERAKRNGPTVLVAPSGGGITATTAANARPELIDRITYVSAWYPVDPDVTDYYTQPEMADVDAGAFAGTLVGNPAGLGLLRDNFRTADPAALAAFKRAFTADLTDDGSGPS